MHRNSASFRRLEFKFIMKQWLRKMTGNSHTVKQIIHDLALVHQIEEPFQKKIRIENCKLHFGERTLDLSRRKKLYSIIRCFLNSSDGTVSLEQLVESLYQDRPDSRISHRLRICRHQSTIKMLSRGRMDAKRALTFDTGSENEWFSYLVDRDRYALFLDANNVVKDWTFGQSAICKPVPSAIHQIGIPTSGFPSMGPCKNPPKLKNP